MNQAVKNENKKTIELLFCLFLCFIIPSLSLYLYYMRKAPDKEFRLSDTDCYMRLVRVRQLHETGRWFDRTIRRSNPPYGEVLHWTRPLDVLLLGGAYAFSIFTDFDKALFFWGVLISPVILGLIAYFLRWTALLLLSKDGPTLAILILMFQGVIINRCQAGRPDHHSLMILLFVLSAGFFIRNIFKPSSKALLFGLALVNALALWILMEAITWVLITAAFMGCLWIWLGEDYLKKCFIYSASIAAFAAIFLLIERGLGGFASIEYNSISIVHLYLLTVISIVLIPSLIMERFTPVLRKRQGRFICGFLAALAAGVAMRLVFPDFFGGPMVNLDDNIKKIWFTKIQEVQPLLSFSMPAISIQVISSFFVALIYVLYLIKTRTGKNERLCWIYILIMLVCFFVLAAQMLRWAVYAQVIITLLLAELAAEAIGKVRPGRLKIWRTLKRITIIIAVSAGFYLLALSVNYFTEVRRMQRPLKQVYLADICKYLTGLSKDADKPMRIVTHLDFGPEILYRTNCEVIATPCSFSTAGITDTYEIMTAESDQRALSLIDKRQADTILLCPQSPEWKFYSKPDCSDTFYQRLKKGDYPKWLKKIELPEKLSESFVILKVTE
jgi:asparagine N-glycosylation enzyme membrane subunit Stt3